MSYADLTNTRHLLLLFWLRSFAGAAQLLTMLITTYGLHIVLPLGPMLLGLGAITAVNIATGIRLWRYPDRPTRNRELFFQMLMDVGALSVLLFFTGGVTNPFMNLFLLQVVIAAVILRPVYCLIFVVLTVSAFGFLCVHHHDVPVLENLHYYPPFDLYSQGAMVGYFVAACVLGLMVVSLVENRRRQDAALADVQQRQINVEHITRTGLLAAGAAHELGTPLATMNVICSDWQKFAESMDKNEILADVPMLLAQIERCKQSVSALLRAAGNTRGEQAEITRLDIFIDKIATSWRTRQGHDLICHPLPPNLAATSVIADKTLAQALHILLDNALEAGAPEIWLDVIARDNQICFRVIDSGPGVPPAIRQNIGDPYNSGKKGESRGLGLYLVNNIARMLGGVFGIDDRASEQPDHERHVTGTIAWISIPLDRLEA